MARFWTRREVLAGLGLAALSPFYLGLSKKRMRRRLVSASRRRNRQRTDVRPNILFILTDDQPAHTLAKMPLTRHAFARGVNLTGTGYVSVPLCGPARAALWSGRYPHTNGVVANPDALPQYVKRGHQHSDLFADLSEAGYDIGFFGKVMNGYGFVGFEWRHPAIKSDTDEWHAMRPGVPPEGTINTAYFAKRAASFVRERADSDSPWMCYLAPYDPHVPHVVPEDVENRYDGATYSSPGVQEADTSDKSGYFEGGASAKEAQRAYEGTIGEVAVIDRRVAGLIDTLRDTGQLDDTLVVFSSDNGYMFGEHGGMMHKGKPYEESARVPFLVMGPGIPDDLPHLDSSPLVSHLDITATIRDAANVGWQRGEGRSLLRYFEDPGIWRKRLLVEMPEPGWWLLRQGRFAYFELPEGQEELYDLEADPYQLENLLRGGAQEPAAAPALRKALSALKRASGADIRAAER